MANETEDRPSLHEVVEAAYEHTEQTGAAERGETVETPEPQNAAEADASGLGANEQQNTDMPAPAAPVRDPKTGKFLRGQPSAPSKGAQPQAGAPRAAPAVAPPPPPAAGAPAFRPPQSWRPNERDAFLKADPTVQQAVMRRERQMAEALQQTAQARAFQEEWNRKVAPYEGAIRAAGKSPVDSAVGLFQTVMQLQSGPQQMKAAIAANIIRGYGIDINMLAAMLDGQMPAPGVMPQQMQQPAPYRDPRVDVLAGEMQAWKAERERQQMALDAEADMELENFASTHPYLDHVIDEMYDMMKVATERGVVLDYEDAYIRTIAALHPDIYEVIQQQQAAQEATNPAGSTARAMAASSSVRGSPAPKPRPEDREMTRREAVEAAWDVHAGGGRV